MLGCKALQGQIRLSLHMMWSCTRFAASHRKHEHHVDIRQPGLTAVFCEEIMIRPCERLESVLRHWALCAVGRVPFWHGLMEPSERLSFYTESSHSAGFVGPESLVSIADNDYSSVTRYCRQQHSVFVTVCCPWCQQCCHCRW